MRLLYPPDTPQARYHEDTAPEKCCVFGLEAEEAGEEALLLGLLCLAACSFFLLAAGCLFVLCLQVGSCASVADGLHVLLFVFCCILLSLCGLLSCSLNGDRLLSVLCGSLNGLVLGLLGADGLVGVDASLLGLLCLVLAGQGLYGDQAGLCVLCRLLIEGASSVG